MVSFWHVGMFEHEHRQPCVFNRFRSPCPGAAPSGIAGDNNGIIRQGVLPIQQGSVKVYSDTAFELNAVSFVVLCCQKLGRESRV